MPDTITVPLGALQAAPPRPAMTFAVVNGQRVPVDDAPARGGTLTVPLGDLEKPAAPAAPAETSDEGLAGFASHYWNQINPVPLGQLIPFPKAFGGGGAWAPYDAAKHLLKAQGAVFDRARDAYDQGDHVAAAIHTLHWLLPVIGPILDKAGDELRAGNTAASLGDTLGLSTALFGPEALNRATARPAPGMGTPTPPTTPQPRLTPEELASNAFATAHDIPLDAATATGSRFVRGVQKVAGESLMGSGPAERAVAQQTAAVQRVGEELADQVKPRAVSPEQGGSGARQSITDSIEALKGSADVAYGQVRDVEARPEHTETIQTAPTGSTGYRTIVRKLAQGWKSEGMPIDAGTAEGSKVAVEPSHPELYTMRQIEQEFEAQPYARGRQVEYGTEFDSDTRYARGSANADVYHDLHSAMGYGDTLHGPSGAAMRADIAHTLETGEWNAASKAAYRVAQERVRVAGGGVGRGPRLGDDAAILGRAERVQLPVDVSAAKPFLASLHDELRRANELTPLQGDLATVYRAVDTLMNGPDQAALSVADAARSSLLKLARTDDPLFRSRGQGVASRAAAAIDEAIQAKAATVPDLAQALEQGRAATRGKYQIGEVLDQLPDEPVKAFDKLTAPRDGHIDLLRKVQQIAPEKMADLGRAKLQQWLDLASERGRFDHADRLYAEWNRLGPQTKRILFGDNPALVKDLDQFFLLAKRLHENPNPSGSATTGVKVGEVVGLVTHPLATLPATVTLGALSKLLYSPKGVQALSEFMRAHGRPAAAASRTGAPAVGPSAASAAALSRLAIVAKAEGVDLGLAADRDETR